MRLRFLHGLIALTLLDVSAMFGCQAPGVGDPCTPEVVPVTEVNGERKAGFFSTEAYLETTSVQCRTRVCLVYKLQGHPAYPREQNPSCPAGLVDCPPENDIHERVYCSCRCGTPEGLSANTCKCPDNFECTEVLQLGGDGVRGSYCVRKGT